MTSKGSVPRLFPLSRRFAPGDLIGGKYRLVEIIGAGAMGAVWVAHNELLDIDVAIKLLRVDNQRADPDRLYKRLLQEARAAARLGHAGIVRVHDFGQADDNSPFIVMELLQGESLADLMARERRIDPIEAMQLALPLLDALATAHGRGIVHRDIKPENIFLARDEYGRLTPKIVDFGVARFAEGGRSMTKSGALLGTPDYMAPEQARGEPDIDHRVDIWALSIVLYELITGTRPFARDSANYLAVLRAIVHEPPPPIQEFGVGDDALWLILERGLRKRRSERWDTMRVLGEALALWLYERGIREDALGASLKATWLEAGLDGIKIDAASCPPPPFEKPSDSQDPRRVKVPRRGVETDLRPSSIIVTEGAPIDSPAEAKAEAAIESVRKPAKHRADEGSTTTWMTAALLFCSFVGGAALWGRALAPERSPTEASNAPALAAQPPQAALVAPKIAPPVSVPPSVPANAVTAAAPLAVVARTPVAIVTPPPAMTVPAQVPATPAVKTMSTKSTVVAATPRARTVAKKSVPEAKSYDFGF